MKPYPKLPRRCLTMTALSVLIGCSTGPAPRTYVLHAPSDATIGVVPESNRPVVELKPVSVPDYLDTTDIMLRNGRNELTISPTGRWGERLSIGVGHALGAALVARLPAVRVVTAPTQAPHVRRVAVDIEAFDLLPDGRCILTARWTILAVDGRSAALVERGTFGTQAAQPLTDATLVAAMADAVLKLADLVATAIERLPGRPRSTGEPGRS